MSGNNAFDKKWVQSVLLSEAILFSSGYIMQQHLKSLLNILVHIIKSHLLTVLL